MLAGRIRYLLPVIAVSAVVLSIIALVAGVYYTELNKAEFLTDEDVLPEIKQACDAAGAELAECKE